MSVDEIARRAGAELREDVLVTTDVERALVALQGRSRRRQRARVTAGVVATVAVVAVGVPATVAGWRWSPDVEDPASTDRSSPTDCSVMAQVSCPRPGRVRVGGPSAYRLHVPDGFLVPRGQVLAPGLFDVFQEGVRAGVTVVQDAVPVGSGDDQRGARDLASWIASRPFLEARAPSRTVVGGTHAWVVDVRLAHGAVRESDRCNGSQSGCHRLLRSGADPLDWEIGPWTDRISRFYCVDAPGSRVTVLWSWAFVGNEQALDANDDVVRGFSLVRR